ncbi:MAG: hypothetical protein HZB26_11870 [Candidatus Hydrogenedentes bacterium]|nr:hypothetical protein [Candidatus Hydrogenedentota bacterium]
MTILCGILGRCDSGAVRRMASAMGVRESALHVDEGDAYAVASADQLGKPVCVVDGSPRGRSGNRLSASAFSAHCCGLKRARDVDVGGAFAAVVKVESGRWWLLRDRLGRKPLYYAERDGALFFASQLKGLLASGLVPKHLNLAALDRYLTLRCVPGPESIVQGVYRVPPGHALVYDAGKISDETFSEFDLSTHDAPRDEAAEALLECLRQSVARTDSSAVLFSGGLDSAALTALQPRSEALFIQLERSWQNEARFARESARLMKRPLRSSAARKLTEESFIRAIHALDEPLADAMAMPLWLLFEEAARHAPTVISGHGADELLGGFPRYHFLQKTHGAHGLIPVTLLGDIAPVLPPNSFIRRGSRYLTAIHDDLRAHLSLIAVFDRGEREAMYTDVMKSALSEPSGAEMIARRYFTHDDLTRNLLSFDLGVGFPDLLVAKWERLAAASGLTVEMPFLDDSMVDFAAALPPQTKFGVRSKPLLRMAMKGIVPARVRLRTRRDFKFPMEGRLVQVIEGLSRQIITRDRVEGIGVFKWPHIEQVVRSSTHNIYRRRQFWALLMFFAWYREFMEA